jgi:hypothetical protein
MESSSTSRYLIRPGDVDPGWVVLYAITWALQWICAGVRYLVAYGVLWLVSHIMGWGLPVHDLALLIGFGPLIISLATLVLPLGGWWWEQQSGGRQPSERERTAFDYAFTQLIVLCYVRLSCRGGLLRVSWSSSTGWEQVWQWPVQHLKIGCSS